jgi:hypothetical protein
MLLMPGENPTSCLNFPLSNFQYSALNFPTCTPGQCRAEQGMQSFDFVLQREAATNSKILCVVAVWAAIYFSCVDADKSDQVHLQMCGH